MVVVVVGFAFAFLPLTVELGRGSPAAELCQSWDIAPQDGAKICWHELMFPGVSGRLSESQLSSAAFVSLYINKQEW